jgi:hypothetical protein
VNFCKGGLAEKIEVMLDRKFYQVICIENFGGGGPASDWKPYQIRSIAQAHDFSKRQEKDAQSNRDAKAPPAPINAPVNPQGRHGGTGCERLLALCEPADGRELRQLARAAEPRLRQPATGSATKGHDLVGL